VFARAEGIEALQLLGVAGACYRQAAETRGAARAANELERWTGRLNEEYAALRLRLRVALDHGRHSEALLAVRGLQSLTGARPGTAYAEWLTALRRELDRKVTRLGT
jgi:hypothetical protein